MAHHILVDLRCARKQDLTSCTIAFGILDTMEGACAVAGTVENDFGGAVREGGVNVRELLADEVHAVVFFEHPVQVLDVLGCVDGDGGAGYAELTAVREGGLGEDSELFLT
jgi:hypothetical protein